MSQKDKVFKLLELIKPFPKQDRDNIVSRPKGMTDQQFFARNQGLVLGKIYSWSKTKDGRSGVINSRKTEMPKYKELFEEASKLMKQHNPNFKFTSIQINKDQKTIKHKDGRNVGKSYIIGLGDYTGGDVRLYNPDGKGYKDINIKNRWATFDGSKLEHETLAFKGTRYSLVYYSVN